MHNDLLPYYNRELASLRQLGKEFAAQFPKVAGRLLLEEGVSEDPHVERLLEGFAFLTARVHHKLDSEFPEITDALLNVLYPHYLRPIPSMSIAQMRIDPKVVNLSAKLALPRHTTLLSRRVNDMPCRFRTAYPIELWPLEVSSAKFEPTQRTDFALRKQDTAATIRIRLSCFPGQFFNDLGVDRLRFFLQGEPAVTHALYELLFNNVNEVSLSVNGALTPLPRDCIRPVGFEENEGMLDYDQRSSLAYRLLHEYFVFPDKFMFVDFARLDSVALPPGCREIEIVIQLGEFEKADRIAKLADTIDADTFRLGCTPIVNLFRQNAEPLQITHLKTEYQVIADIRRPWGMEIYSVDHVRKLVKDEGGGADVVEYQPFYGLHHSSENIEQQTFWMSARRPSERSDDAGTEMYLSLVDLEFNPNVPPTDALSIEVTCTNRDLPGLLPFGGEQGDFEVDGGSPVTRIHCLRKPTPTLRPPMGRSSMWRLISHLSLNHLSIADGEGESTEAFREILGLYNFTGSAATRKQVEGVQRVTSKPTLARVGSRGHSSFVRGIEVCVEFDEEAFEGAGAFLMACVLERFVGHYATINSFTQFVARSQQREKAIKTWQPRAGSATLA